MDLGQEFEGNFVIGMFQCHMCDRVVLPNKMCTIG